MLPSPQDGFFSGTLMSIFTHGYTRYTIHGFTQKTWQQINQFLDGTSPQERMVKVLCKQALKSPIVALVLGSQ